MRLQIVRGSKNVLESNGSSNRAVPTIASGMAIVRDAKANRRYLLTSETKYGYSFKLQDFRKRCSQKPFDVMQEWYAKLTPEQQTKVFGFKTLMNRSIISPTANYLRGRKPASDAAQDTVKIAIRPELIKQIWDEYGGDPGDGTGDRELSCAAILSGTTWSGHPPYFEFDDRTPDKYLLVGSYGHEGPPIDLNSLRF